MATNNFSLEITIDDGAMSADHSKELRKLLLKPVELKFLIVNGLRDKCMQLGHPDPTKRVKLRVVKT